MNEAKVMRADVDGLGVRLRLWVDDELGHHLTVCEVRLGYRTLVEWGNAILTQERDAAQYQLEFDD